MAAGNELIYALPKKHDYGIGIIGAGGIVNAAHLPAYRKAGLNVVAICDINETAVGLTAKRWEISDYYTDYRKLLARTDIHIIDIAIPNEGRVEIVREAVATGKHVLIQKPFAYKHEQALEMVQLARAAGVKLAVNQNARFAPFYNVTKQIIDSGVLGELYLITHEMRINQDAVMGDTWFAKVPHFLIVDYDIHHIDLMRFWSGMTPERVFTSTTRMPGQNFASDMIALTTMEFANGLRGSLMTVDTTQSDDHFWRFTIEGTKGSLYGSIEDNYKFPKIKYSSKDKPDQWISPYIKGDWFSDAFYGTMFELMNAIQEDREPSISGKDNINTLNTMHSIIRSIEEKQVVAVMDC
ncbi:gfo/Idh/MocA family oxidoreductase [Paenibacillus psychroresistens]|uniref:Gfo/Idh/MocA family oxidoreductase n=1 Tax=Paenibacillus psychroresistens TaxID=1778678 RepID=A0A6B8RS55_9BACL|nr:Gfo/Idh/MocA family oxidoreductase [Paenibacillus psychroresistens]QGQ98375.1 gfo/Idh/MocA family oxidoreductase [Paenibacillus psychroresistens]